MNRYFKLVHMEVHRFRWMLAVLMGITATSQIIGIIWTLINELSQRGKLLLQNMGNKGAAAPYSDPLTFEWAVFNTQKWFILPIL